MKLFTNQNVIYSTHIFPMFSSTLLRKLGKHILQHKETADSYVKLNKHSLKCG